MPHPKMKRIMQRTYPNDFCAAKWPGIDYLSDGTRIFHVLGWSDFRRSVSGDVVYRLSDMADEQLVTMKQRDLMHLGFAAIASDDQRVCAARAASIARFRAAMQRAGYAVFRK